MRMLCRVALLVLLLAMAAAPAAAQCAMCYQNAAAQEARAMRALNLGILLLLFPPVGIMGGILLVAFRYRNADRTAEQREFPAPPSRKTFQVISSRTR